MDPKRTIFVLIIIVFILLLTGPVSGLSPEATPVAMISDNESVPDSVKASSVSDLVTFVSEAKVYAQRVGKDAAIREFSAPDGNFTRGSRYIWAYTFNGTNLAHPYHPEYVGTNKLTLADPTGLLMIESMRDVALNGSGFVAYQYENPETGIVGPKLAYVTAVDDSWWLASGIYGTYASLPDCVPEVIRDRLEQQVEYARAFTETAGKVKAISEFNNQSGRFTTNESYIFAFDRNGTTLAMPFHPEKIGVNESGLTDINGVGIGSEKLQVVKDGGGFWYYVFQNPDNGKSEFKISCARPVDDEWAIGSGTYLSDVQAVFPSVKRDTLVTRVREASEYVRTHGREKAVQEFNNPDGTFSHPDLFIFAFDLNGTLLANPYLPGLVGHNRTTDRDPYGKYPVRQLIAHAKLGGGFTYYFFADPGSEYRVRLKLGYSEQADDTMVIGAGIFPDE